MTREAPADWELARRACERVNCGTHAVGLALGVPAVALLVGETQTTADRAAALVYGLTLLAVYAVSTSLHAIVGRRDHHRLEVLDHAAIYLLIAGTFTPILVRVGGGAGAWMLALAWSLALAGVAFKLACSLRHARLSIAGYLVTGWLPVTILPQILRATSPPVLTWLVLGGLVYTAGVPFFLVARKKPRWHAVWHLFVLLGSASHYRAIWLLLTRR